MGNFYDNYCIRGVSQQNVVAALVGRSAIVTAPVNDIVVVFDAASEQNNEVLSSLAAELSAKCKGPVLAVMNHDDDVLWFALAVTGERVDEYNSSPSYFGDESSGDGPVGGDAEKLTAAFGGDPATVEAVLRADDFVFAIERHAALAEALGLPAFVAGGGFNYISEGELPDGLSEDALIRIS